MSVSPCRRDRGGHHPVSLQDAPQEPSDDRPGSRGYRSVSDSSDDACSAPAEDSPKRERWQPVSYADARRAASLTPGEFRVWVALLFAPERRHGLDVDIPRRFVLDRAGIPTTADTLKKVPSRLRSIERAGLIRVAVEADRVRYRITGTPPARRDGRWTFARLWASDAGRMLDPDDPVTDGLLQAWVCRWLHTVRLDRVQVCQAELAERWGIAAMTVRREAARLEAVGLLSVRRTGSASIVADARLNLPADAPIRTLGVVHRPTRTPDPRSFTSGTRDRSPQAPRRQNTPPTTRTRALDPALDASPVTARQSRQVLNAAELAAGTASGPGTGKKTKPTRPRTSSSAHRAEAWQLVRSVRWLATAPKRAQFPAMSLIAWYLRRGGPAGLPGVWTSDRLRRVLVDADPGETTTDHARIIRAAVAGLVADAKAAGCHECQQASGHLIGCSIRAELADAQTDSAGVTELAAASLANAASSISNQAAAGTYVSKSDRLAEWRTDLLARAEAGPPADPDQLSDFLAGVLLHRHDRTGRPIVAIAGRLGIAPEYASALATASQTAAMIIAAEAAEVRS